MTREWKWPPDPPSSASLWLEMGRDPHCSTATTLGLSLAQHHRVAASHVWAIWHRHNMEAAWLTHNPVVLILGPPAVLYGLDVWFLLATRAWVDHKVLKTGHCSVLYVVTVQGHTVRHRHCTWLCLRDLAGGDLSSAGCFSSRWDGTTPSTSKRNPVVGKAKGCEKCFWIRINLIEKMWKWVAVSSEDNPFQFNFYFCKNKCSLQTCE